MAAGAMVLTSFSLLSVASDNARGKGVLTAGRMGPLLCEVQDGKMVATKMRWRKPYRTACNRQALLRCIPMRGLNTYDSKRLLANPAAPKGVRGSDEFVRVSWDDAYRIIHEQHMRIRKTYGPASVFAGSYG